jgi:hypothetical protein
MMDSSQIKAAREALDRINDFGYMCEGQAIRPMLKVLDDFIRAAEEAKPVATPSFYKGDRVEVRNPFGHIYSGIITKAETRWSADKRPYLYYQVRADGEKTSAQVIPSQIITIATKDGA